MCELLETAIKRRRSIVLKKHTPALRFHAAVYVQSICFEGLKLFGRCDDEDLAISELQAVGISQRLTARTARTAPKRAAGSRGLKSPKPGFIAAPNLPKVRYLTYVVYHLRGSGPLGRREYQASSFLSIFQWFSFAGIILHGKNRARFLMLVGRRSDDCQRPVGVVSPAAGR